MGATTRSDLLFSTDRFNLSEPRDYFINECCFGDDAASWLVEQLRARGLTVTDPDQEDWGWYFDAELGGATYFVDVGGNSDCEIADPNRGQWRLMLQKHRTLWQKLSGANQLDEQDAFIALVKDVLNNDPSVQFVGIE